MLVIIYVLGLIILGMVFGYGFLKIIEHLTNIDKVHIEKAPDNCPCCNKSYFYVNTMVIILLSIVVGIVVG